MLNLIFHVVKKTAGVVSCITPACATKAAYL